MRSGAFENTVYGYKKAGFVVVFVLPVDGKYKAKHVSSYDVITQ